MRPANSFIEAGETSAPDISRAAPGAPAPGGCRENAPSRAERAGEREPRETNDVCPSANGPRLGRPQRVREAAIERRKEARRDKHCFRSSSWNSIDNRNTSLCVSFFLLQQTLQM